MNESMNRFAINAYAVTTTTTTNVVVVVAAVFCVRFLKHPNY